MQNRKVKGFTLSALTLALLIPGSTAYARTPYLGPADKPAVSSIKKVTAPKASSSAKTGKVKANVVSGNPISADAISIAIASALTKESGARYRAGGAGPDGFDCSGLVLWSYAQAGISLPHGSSNQLKIVQRISRDELIPGDLVFSGRSGGGIQHVALYIGDGKVIHATYASASLENQVRIDDLDGSWVMHHKAYGRIVQ